MMNKKNYKITYKNEKIFISNKKIKNLFNNKNNYNSFKINTHKK
jgi:hypothetical protein